MQRVSAPGDVLTGQKSPRYWADRDHSTEGRHGLLTERAECAWVYSAGKRCARPRRFVPLLVIWGKRVSLQVGGFRKTLCLFN